MMTFMEAIISRFLYRNWDIPYSNVQSAGSFIKLTGSNIKYAVNSQLINVHLPIVKTLRNFLLLVYSVAEKSIPRTSASPRHSSKRWFNEDCKKAIAERKRIFRNFSLRPTQENLSKFKIARAKARRTIKQSKRRSWRQFVSRLNSRSSVKKPWDRIRIKILVT